MTIAAILTSVFLLFQSGNVSIEGTVTSKTTNKPIAGAQVSLARLQGIPDNPRGMLTRGTLGSGVITIVGTGVVSGARVIGNQGPSVQIPSATTDTSGHFIFTDLAPGTYSIRATADGYVQQESAPGEPGGMTAVVMPSAGQAIRDVALRLTEGGTVSGRVTGSTGEPLVNMEVALVRTTFGPDGRKMMSSVTTAQTNDRGEYRLFWVPPGDYRLSVASSPRPVPGMAFRPETINKYPRVFYPDTRDPESATILVVRSAAEISGMDFRLIEPPKFRIRGRLIDSTGAGTPARGVSIGIYPRDTLVTGGVSSSAPYNPADGTFELRDVPSGRYIIRAQISPAFNPPYEERLQPPLPLTAIAEVDVVGADVDGVVLDVTSPVSISGRIRVEGAASTVSPGRMTVTLRPAGSGMVFGSVPRPAQTDADGTFTLEGVGPGDYLLQFFPPTDFNVKSAVMAGMDILSHPFTVSTSAPGSIDIVLAGNAGRVTGMVSGAQGNASGIQVVLVPDQRDRNDLYRFTRADSGGHFVFPPLPAGSYKAFAFETIEPFSWFDPAVLKPYESAATPVIVGAADVTLNLKVADHN
jgi:Carboxypeptidase regulatory-like domain